MSKLRQGLGSISKAAGPVLQGLGRAVHGFTAGYPQLDDVRVGTGPYAATRHPYPMFRQPRGIMPPFQGGRSSHDPLDRPTDHGMSPAARPLKDLRPARIERPRRMSLQPSRR